MPYSPESQLTVSTILGYILKFTLAFIKSINVKTTNIPPLTPNQNLVGLVVMVGGVLELVEGVVCDLALACCHEWYLKQMPQAELFTKQLLFVLVRLVLEEISNKKSTITTIYQLKNVLNDVLLQDDHMNERLA